MRPLETIIAGTLALLAAVPLSAQTRAAENKKPNILFIITDDHAYQTLGTSKQDSPVALPNFNKLAKQGMVFDRSYCATFCQGGTSERHAIGSCRGSTSHTKCTDTDIAAI